MELRNAKRAKDDFTRRVPIRAPRERVYDALTTLEGLRGWWTTRARGRPVAGGELRLEFAGLEEYIVMGVDAATRPLFVQWTCIVHTELEEWNGTRVEFRLPEAAGEGCELSFRHVGLVPKLECYADSERNWDRLLASLVAYLEQGRGEPVGA